MGSIYKGSFVNTQVDYTDNSPNEQTFYVTITDLSTTVLPYSLTFLAIPIGGGQQSMTVSWAGLPVDCSSLVIGYSLAGQGSYTNITINNPAATDTYTWNVAVANYDIRIEVVRSAGPSETFDIYYIEYQLEMADAPIVIQTVDNSEDKFSPIKSKSCRIRVFTNDDINAMTFAAGGDTQYKVEVAVNAESEIIYTGWLSLSDLGQTFQPDPNVLELTATDGIAFLKTVALADDEGRYLQGPHPLIKYIAWALQKTGIELDIWIQMNLLEVSAIYDYPEYHFYNTVFLDAQTFEEEVGTLQDCYTVLEKILGEFCELSQQKNVWFIKSIDEANYAQFRICRFTSAGDPVDFVTELYAKDIGSDSDYYTMAFMNDDARLSLQRPYKSVIHRYNFDYPTEIVQNINFERGDVLQEPDFNQATSYGIYKIEGWTHFKNTFLSPDANYVAQIIKTYNYGDLEDSFVRLNMPVYLGTAPVNVNNVRSTPIYVKQGDIINISIQAQIAALTPAWWQPLHVRIVPDTGSDVYDWEMINTQLNDQGQPIVNQWNVKDPSVFDWSLWTVTNTIDAVGGINQGITSTSAEIEIPYDGKLYVRLLNGIFLIPGSDVYSSTETYFRELTIDFTTRIAGSWAKYTGQEHISQQDIDTLAMRENQVYMSDAPRIEMKGSMLKRIIGQQIYSGLGLFADGNSVSLDGDLTSYININDYLRIYNTTNNNGVFRIIAFNYASTPNKTVIEFDESTIDEVDATTNVQIFNYQLTENFYDSIEYPGGGAPQSAQLPYGQHQNQAVWNQYNRVFSIFEATVDGLDTNVVDNLGLPDLPDLMHMYRQKDDHPATYNKQFKCLHYEQDTDNCEWSIYMIEVGDASIGKSYLGHTFKYFQK